MVKLKWKMKWGNTNSADIKLGKYKGEVWIGHSSKADKKFYYKFELNVGTIKHPGRPNWSTIRTRTVARGYIKPISIEYAKKVVQERYDKLREEYGMK
jgi:hypothetical protein